MVLFGNFLDQVFVVEVILAQFLQFGGVVCQFFQHVEIHFLVLADLIDEGGEIVQFKGTLIPSDALGELVVELQIDEDDGQIVEEPLNVEKRLMRVYEVLQRQGVVEERV